MSFKITITETRIVKKIVGKDYVVIGSKEVERDLSFRSSPNEPKTRVDPVYGYSPEIEKSVPETVTVLEQTVDLLDLKTVIAAINGMGRKKRKTAAK
jgi:hypothetical protein